LSRLSRLSRPTVDPAGSAAMGLSAGFDRKRHATTGRGRDHGQMVDETTDDLEAIKAQIRGAFSNAGRPGPGTMHVSEQSDEASVLLESDFDGRGDWADLDAAFVDQAPAGFGSALSFLSDGAFRYYLPAYLIADLDGALYQADPVFHLTHGLTDATRGEHLGGRDGLTWWEVRTTRVASFTPDQRIVHEGDPVRIEPAPSRGTRSH
jgi:hypothetical protein